MSNGASGRIPFPDFWRVWRDLLEATEGGGALVLVEGEKDRRSVERLGVQGPVELVHRGRSLADLAHRLGGTPREVIVLTDWDATGGELARRLKGLLHGGTVRVNLDLRRRLGLVLRGEITHLEGLASWAARRAEEGGTPLEVWLSDPDRPLRE
jgi:5S rRNA maturation endonuclease (ribonuclease M5)